MEEIFSKIKVHLLEGLVFHDEMTRYFSMLGLKGYAKCHLYHYAEENKSYKCLSDYYMEHHGMLIPTEPMGRPDVIPNNWYGVKRSDVDRGTKQSAVKAGFKKWVEWERETKKLYESMTVKLMESGNVADAIYIAKLVDDVDYELSNAECKLLELDAIGYDLQTIVTEQIPLHEKYCRKINELMGGN